VSPNHDLAALPSRLLTPDEAEKRLRARQPWADLWRCRVSDPEPEPPPNDKETAPGKAPEAEDEGR
jgi:hypothetical protein